MALDQSSQARIQNEIADRLEEIKRLVKGSEHYRATCILRATHLPDGNVVVTDDSFSDVMAALKREADRYQTE